MQDCLRTVTWEEASKASLHSFRFETRRKINFNLSSILKAPHLKFFSVVAGGLSFDDIEADQGFRREASTRKVSIHLSSQQPFLFQETSYLQALGLNVNLGDGRGKQYIACSQVD